MNGEEKSRKRKLSSISSSESHSLEISSVKTTARASRSTLSSLPQKTNKKIKASHSCGDQPILIKLRATNIAIPDNGSVVQATLSSVDSTSIHIQKSEVGCQTNTTSNTIAFPTVANSGSSLSTTNSTTTAKSVDVGSASRRCSTRVRRRPSAMSSYIEVDPTSTRSQRVKNDKPPVDCNTSVRSYRSSGNDTKYRSSTQDKKNTLKINRPPMENSVTSKKSSSGTPANPPVSEENTEWMENAQRFVYLRPPSLSSVSPNNGSMLYDFCQSYGSLMRFWAGAFVDTMTAANDYRLVEQTQDVIHDMVDMIDDYSDFIVEESEIRQMIMDWDESMYNAILRYMIPSPFSPIRCSLIYEFMNKFKDEWSNILGSRPNGDFLRCIKEPFLSPFYETAGARLCVHTLMKRVNNLLSGCPDGIGDLATILERLCGSDGLSSVIDLNLTHDSEARDVVFFAASQSAKLLRGDWTLSEWLAGINDFLRGILLDHTTGMPAKTIIEYCKEVSIRWSVYGDFIVSHVFELAPHLAANMVLLKSLLNEVITDQCQRFVAGRFSRVPWTKTWMHAFLVQRYPVGPTGS